MLYKKRSMRPLVAFATMAIIGIHRAYAGTTGDTVTMDLRFPAFDSAPQLASTQLVTGSATSYDLATFTGTVTNTQIVFDQWQFSNKFQDSAFNGVVVTDQNKGWGRFSIDPSTNMAGFNASDITIKDNMMAVNFSGFLVNPNTRVVLDVAAVPEPASYALLLAGLAMIGCVARRKKSS
jgi:hypothetical protein